MYTSRWVRVAYAVRHWTHAEQSHRVRRKSSLDHIQHEIVNASPALHPEVAANDVAERDTLDAAAFARRFRRVRTHTLTACQWCTRRRVFQIVAQQSSSLSVSRSRFVRDDHIVAGRHAESVRKRSVAATPLLSRVPLCWRLGAWNLPIVSIA